jgi:hypothetical protein
VHDGIGVGPDHHFLNSQQTCACLPSLLVSAGNTPAGTGLIYFETPLIRGITLKSM